MSDTFCVLPWFGQEISWDNKHTHCCLLPKDYDVNKIKSEMLKGERPVECQKCWHLEANNIKSDRQLKNSTLDWVMDKDIEFIKQDAILGNTETLILKLMTSYTCNATCVSCQPYSSSAWNQLQKKMFNIVPEQKYKFVDVEKVKHEVNFKNLKMLSLLGGEPLYEKRNFELLEHLLELGNDTVFLSLVTNGSVELSTHQKNILSKFKNINFSLSIDGTERVFEYVRYPLKWNQLLDNLQFFRAVTDNISANYTISNLNILYHNDTVAWFDKEKIPFSKNPIYSPNWLQPKVLPKDVRLHLKTILTPTDYNMLIGDPDDNQIQMKFDVFRKEILQQDNAKEISLKDYLPELAQLIDY